VVCIGLSYLAVYHLLYSIGNSIGVHILPEPVGQADSSIGQTATVCIGKSFWAPESLGSPNPNPNLVLKGLGKSFPAMLVWFCCALENGRALPKRDLGVGAWKISVEDVARPSGYGKLRVGFGDRRRGDKAPNNVTVKPNLSLQALIGCSFRRKTTDTTKHTGADHMASR